jgi:hypothetical protein
VTNFGVFRIVLSVRKSRPSVKNEGEKSMKRIWKIFAVSVLLSGSALGLTVLKNASPEQPIYVSLRTSPEAVKKAEPAKIMLQADLNGNGLAHGHVSLSFSPVSANEVVRGIENHVSIDSVNIEGDTDFKGVFITNWRPPSAGEYMVCATVEKVGCQPGQSVTFLKAKE